MAVNGRDDQSGKIRAPRALPITWVGDPDFFSFGMTVGMSYAAWVEECESTHSLGGDRPIGVRHTVTRLQRPTAEARKLDAGKAERL
jgi:hypothetical protein